MLRRLAEEVRQEAARGLVSPVELIVCVEDVALEECREVVREALGRDAGLFELRLLPARGEYYELKNLATAAAGGELIVFLDSDVIPEEGWLGHMLAPFADPEIAVVVGNTSVELTSTYSRAFALTWMFPLRSSSDEVGPVTSFYANNLAFRRQVAARNAFPSIPETSRGACQVLARDMRRRGVRMVSAGGARAAHPAPAGLDEFFLRALSRGRDRLVLFVEPGRAGTWRGTWARFRRDMTTSVRAISQRRAELGLSRTALPAVLAVNAAFTACIALGELLTIVDRDFMTSHFRV